MSAMVDGLQATAAAGLPGSIAEFDRGLRGDDWSAHLAQLHEQGLVGLLLSAVEAGDVSLPPEHTAQLAEHHTAAMARVLLLERLLLHVTALLEDSGIEHRVLKGSAFAHLDYTNPSLRPFSDVDLLVREDEMGRAIAVLTRDGFQRNQAAARPDFDRRFGKGATLIAPGGLELDLHRTFVKGAFGVMIDIEDLWDRPQPFTLAGQTLLAMSPEARVMHAAFHAVLGNWPPRLLPYRDLAEMLLFGRYDDHELRRLSAAWRADAVLATAVRETWEVLALADLTALSTWSTRYVVSGKDERLLALHRSPDPSYAAQSLAAVRHIARWRDRARFVTSLTWPSKEFLRDRNTTLPRYLVRGLNRSRRRP